MKIKTSRPSSKAVRMFTDREEPRAAFWKQYNAVKAELQQDSNVHVLNFYGIGGIGKSSLLKKLISEMKEELSAPRYIYIDLSNGQESRAVLDKMRNMLADTYGFSFPLFELASYVYAQKLGDKVSPLEVQALTKKSPILSFMMSAAGSIPVLGVATKVLSLADQGVAVVRSYLKNHSRELKQIEFFEAEELYKKLPALFAIDLTYNLEDTDEPLVIFLDTYEALVNELSSIGEPLTADEWIRGDEGLVQYAANTLWVISGREKLKWERFDRELGESVESHILGNLSQSDSEHFLEQAGIIDGKLRTQLYALTNGTPVYLDLCVDQFSRMLNEGIKPEISLFGQNTFELITRFIRYMDNAHQDLVYMLACLDKWDDALIADISASPRLNFSWTSYSKAKDYSFVIASEDGMYNIHQTVGTVLCAGCPDIIKSSVRRSLVSIFADTLNDVGAFSSDFARASTYIAQACLLSKNRDEFFEFYSETVHDHLILACAAGQFQLAKNVFDMLWHVIEQDKGDLLYACAVSDKSYFLQETGDYNSALQHAESALSLYTHLLGHEHPDTFSAMNRLSAVLFRLGKYNEAYELSQLVLEKSTAALGADYHDTLIAMNNSASALSALGKHEDALALNLIVLEKTTAEFGEEHPVTITQMHNLAETLTALGKYEDALSLNRIVLEKSVAVFGENHPQTISAINGLGSTLYSSGRHEEALELAHLILEKNSAVFGESHPNTVTAMSNLALACSGLGRYEEAIELSLLVFEARVMLLGAEHPLSISAQDNMFSILSEPGNDKAAAELFVSALTKRLKLLGAEHPFSIAMQDALEQMTQAMDALGDD